MDLQEIYKKETGFDVGKIHDTGTTYYSDDYVKWLEKQVQELRKHDVVGRSEQLVCEYCNDDAKPTCCDSCLKNMAHNIRITRN